MRGGFRARAEARSAGAARGNRRASFIPCNGHGLLPSLAYTSVLIHSFNWGIFAFWQKKCEAASARERRREAPEPRAEAAELRLSVASFTSVVGGFAEDISEETSRGGMGGVRDARLELSRGTGGLLWSLYEAKKIVI